MGSPSLFLLNEFQIRLYPVGGRDFKSLLGGLPPSPAKLRAGPLFFSIDPQKNLDAGARLLY
jgi:hypothetical protein